MTVGQSTYIYLSSTMSYCLCHPRAARAWSQKRSDFTVSHRWIGYLLLQDRPFLWRHTFPVTLQVALRFGVYTKLWLCSSHTLGDLE